MSVKLCNCLGGDGSQAGEVGLQNLGGDDEMAGAGGDDAYIYGFGDGDDIIRDVAGTADSLQISADVLTARQGIDTLTR